MSLLVLMACSATKLPDGRKSQPAHTLYNGPMWQTLRVHKPKGLQWPNVLVLSAMYGVISATDGIGPYDAKMTPAKADYLIEKGPFAGNDHIGTLKWLPPGASPAELAGKGTAPYSKVIVAASGEYARVFTSFLPKLVTASLVLRTAIIHQTKGGIGEQREQLGKWVRS